jgi:serine/threonine protein kinase
VKLQKEGIDPVARDLLQHILTIEPNLRISLTDIKEHRFFAHNDWSRVKSKSMGPPPYKPNPMKYRYLLANKYADVQGMNEEVNADIVRVNKELEDF